LGLYRAIPRSKLRLKVISEIKNNLWISLLAMAIACVPLLPPLPVFGCLEAGSIPEILAFGTPHLIRGAIRVHVGEEIGIFVIYSGENQCEQQS
jgi:hypothetical protein